MTRLRTSLSDLKKQGRKALAVFLTAGCPSSEETVRLAVAASRAGADIIEIGIPFSDPVADGPLLQKASEIALANGTSMETVFTIVSAIRESATTPIVLMGYYNPLLRYGLKPFFSTCASRGIDGVIIADLPPEESGEYVSEARERDIATIFLATPTTPSPRLRLLDELSTGFIYAVSVTGVTGIRTDVYHEADGFLAGARQQIRENSLLVGFGISTPDDASRLADRSDGIIIGSAVMNILLHSKPESRKIELTQFIRGIREAIDFHPTSHAKEPQD